MLVLTQPVDEAVVIDLRKWGLGLVEVMPVRIQPDKVRFGYDADPQIPVHRKSVFEAIEREGRK